MSTEQRHSNTQLWHVKLSRVLSPRSWDQQRPWMLKKKSSGVGQRGDFPCVKRQALVTSTLIALMELSGQQSAGPWHCMGRGRPVGENDSRGGVKVTAEECLLCSLFAMVSSDCHVRNARARTTGLGMLPSVTSLADEIWNLHLSTGPIIYLYIVFTFHLNPCSCNVILSASRCR